jgi:putative ABC transport system substrate-binding protein
VSEIEFFRMQSSEQGHEHGKAVPTADLALPKVKIILAANAPAAIAAGRATSAIPIVLLAVNDPVGLGLVKSLERPDTNVTGTTMYAPQLIGERLRILKRIIPSLDKIAMMMNGNNPNNAG